MGRMTPYFLFMGTVRDSTKQELIAAGQEATLASVGKAIGAKWRALGEEEKAAWKEKADEHNAEEKERLAAEGGEVEANDGGTPGEAAPEQTLPFPVTVLKRLIKEDKDIKKCSNDGMRAIAFATELFLQHLAEEAGGEAIKRKRVTVKYDDVEEATRKQGRYDFLKEVLEDCKPLPKENAGNARGNGTTAGKKERAPRAKKVREEGEEGEEGEGGEEGGGEAAEEEEEEEEVPDNTRRMTDFFKA